MKVPIFDPKREHEEQREEIEKSVLRVLRSGKYVLGEEVVKLERALSAFVGQKYGVGVNSGTDGLTLALKALKLPPNSKVVVPDFTFYATAEAVALAGFQPVFADVDPHTFNMEPEQLEEALKEDGVSAVISVSIFGNPPHLEEIAELCNRRSVLLVEDVAQSLGSKTSEGKAVGSYGVVSVTSFYPTKNLGAEGDGGMVFTSDEEIAARLRSLRNHCQVSPYVHDGIGTNSRLDEVQAAILNVKFGKLVERIEKKRHVAREYDSVLAGKCATQKSNGYHSYHLYTVKVDPSLRDRFLRELNAAGIGARVYYPSPVSAFFGGRGKKNAEKLCSSVLSLPLFSGIREEEWRYVAETAERLLTRLRL